ncbi:MAG TPA: SH3 domain-containing protein, partial [Anaerolineae bacterium]|nr:SH3 domain-containing protein [Anaerolineae bacterium]
PVPTPTVSPEIAVGRYVQVAGTEGAGVSLRQDPDVNSPRLGVGYEGEVFIVLDGPRQVGGYVWWLVCDPEDEARQGWAVGNYLEPVEHP